MHSNAVPPNVARNVLFGQWTYWCSLVIAAMGAYYIPPGYIRTAVMLIPVLGAFMCMLVAYWLYEDCDEFIRIQLLKAVAATAIIVAACTLGYFFLELAGFPRVSMVWINLVGWGAFSLQLILIVRRAQ